MLRFVLTGNGHGDVTKPQLLPFASAKTALCQESSRMNQIIENLLWPCFKNIWQSGACIKLTCLNQNLMLQETAQAKQQFWTTSSQNHPSQDSTPPLPPPPCARETFEWGEHNSYCVLRGLGFGSRHSSDILQNGFYCCLSPNEALIDAEEKDQSPEHSFAL